MRAGDVRQSASWPAPGTSRAPHRDWTADTRLDLPDTGHHVGHAGFDPGEDGLRIDPDEQDRSHDRYHDEVLAQPEVRETSPHMASGSGATRGRAGTMPVA